MSSNGQETAGGLVRLLTALVYDNHQVEPPRTPEQGYHLTEDLVDKAIGFITASTTTDGGPSAPGPGRRSPRPASRSAP